MSTLKIKILSLVSTIVLAIIISVAFVEYRMQKSLILENARSDAQLLAETIMSSISNAMLSGRSSDVQSALARFIGIKPIKGLRILSESGKVLNSADVREIGTARPAPPPASNGDSSFTRPFSTFAFTTSIPIFNKPECHGCHPASQLQLGTLSIEIALDHHREFINKQQLIAIFFSLTMMILVVAAISILLIVYMDRPLRQLSSLMERLEQGDLSVRSDVGGTMEMHTFSTNFNRMVTRFKSMMEATVERERELAQAQERLAHHNEIQLMNRKLEEQLLEIESLNISLEERIEEIEEANYKIADLAGDLEDKNTNLESAVVRLSTLYKVGLAINSTMETHRLFHLIVQTAMETLSARIGYIILVDPVSSSLRVTTLLGHDHPDPERLDITLKPSSIANWVITNRKPLLVSDINRHPEFDRFSVLGYERKTVVCAPLVVKDELIGTITVVNKIDDSVFSNDDLDLLTTIAAQASIAIKNANLYEEQQRTYMNTIHALVTAIEASDSYTRGHSERVTRYSVELGRRLDLPPERLKIIERAAILHDIGKIGIDLSLLNKEGRLSIQDVEHLQQHPLIGMKILEPIDFLQDVRLCIGQHHERYDGLGYPNKVTSDMLLLESRILAIADAFDAMTSDRPYRRALPLNTALRELIDNAGTQFDPNLVPLFVQMVEEHPFTFNDQFVT